MYSKPEVNATSKYGLDYILNDGEEPPPEIPNDVFDRQRVMKNFHQFSIEKQCAFVLGVGGIGSSIAMCLVRMGIDTIYLLDRDHIEPSNLNRQILFSINDIGRSKAETAARYLKEMHNLRTNIHYYHTDAVTNWSCVVEIAKKSTVIFNNIDYGAVFDYAVNSLCLLSDPCWACANVTNDSFKFSEQDFKDFKDISSFLKEKCNISGEQSQSIVEECLKELKINLYSKIDFSSSFMSLYQSKTLELLLPQYIKNHQSIDFIPKDKSFPTRMVGSWISVCVSGSCLIVNTWMQYIMMMRNFIAETNKTFHNWTQINLSMFDGGYATSGFSNEQNQNCQICSNIKHIMGQNL